MKEKFNVIEIFKTDNEKLRKELIEKIINKLVKDNINH